jgi:catechol 2,3-dioxygenase-like lactoylglutathione lyase family enzyme
VRGVDSCKGVRRELPQFATNTVVELDHVQIAAPPGCEAEARRFYGGVLGLEEVEKPEPLRARGGVWFQAGDRQLHVGVEQDFAPARKAHPAFRVSEEELDRLAAELDAGWDDSLPGVRRFYVADPWGNRVEILGV